MVTEGYFRDIWGYLSMFGGYIRVICGYFRDIWGYLGVFRAIVGISGGHWGIFRAI